MPDAGVVISNLEISVAPDDAELQLHVEIERNLGHNKSPMAWFQLPAAHGGFLEVAEDIVVDLIDRHAEAGYDMTSARRKLEAGRQAYDRQDWKAAYFNYRSAYRYVIR